MDTSFSTSESNPSHANLPAFQLPQSQETIQKERKARGWFWLIFLAALALGYFGGWLYSSLNGPPDPDRIRLSGWQSLLLISAIPFAAFFAILTHELGHVIGGKLAGLQFLFLVVGPMKVTRSKQRLVWQINRSIALMGGLACCIPTDAKKFLPALKWMIIGGPLASLLLAAVCYILNSYVDLLPFSPSWILLVSRLLPMGALMSLMIAAVTIYPGTAGNLKTDGRQFLELLKSTPHARRQNQVRLLVGQSLAGIRPSEWESEVIDELDVAYAEVADDESLPERVMWSTLRSAVAVDRHDFESAHKLIQFSLTHSELYPIFARGSLFLEAALFEARVRHDADAAESLIEAAPEGMMVESYLLPSAQAEISRLRGDPDKAKALAQEALNATASALDAGGVVPETEHLFAIINDTDSPNLQVR